MKLICHAFTVGVSFVRRKQIQTQVHKTLLFEYSTKPQSNSWGSKKFTHQKKKVHYPQHTMADTKVEEILAPLRACVKEQVTTNTFFQTKVAYCALLIRLFTAE